MVENPASAGVVGSGPGVVGSVPCRRIPHASLPTRSALQLEKARVQQQRPSSAVQKESCAPHPHCEPGPGLGHGMRPVSSVVNV